MVPDSVRAAVPSFTKAPPTPEIAPAKVVGPDSLMVRLFPVVITEEVISPVNVPIVAEVVTAEMSNTAELIVTAPIEERAPEPDKARVPSLIVVPPA